MPKTQIGFMASSFSSPLRVVRHKQMTSGKSPKYTYERISFMNKWLGYVPGVCWSFLWDPHATWVFFPNIYCWSQIQTSEFVDQILPNAWETNQNNASIPPKNDLISWMISVICLQVLIPTIFSQRNTLPLAVSTKSLAQHMEVSWNGGTPKTPQNDHF